MQFWEGLSIMLNKRYMFLENESIKETRRVMKDRNPILFTLCLFFVMNLMPAVIAFLLGLIIYPLVKVLKLGYVPKIAYGSDSFMIFDLLSTFFISLAIYFFVKKYQNRNAKSLGLVDDKKLISYTKGILIGGAMLTASFLLVFLFGGFRIRVNIRNISPFLYLLFVIGWIFQGFEEELITRSVLMNYFAAVKDVKTGLIANSLLFAILHVGNTSFNAIAFVNLLLMGLVFSMIFYINDSIYTSAACHSVWNFLQGNFFGINVSGIIDSQNTIFKSEPVGSFLISGGAFGIEASLIVTLVELFVLVILFRKLNKPCH